MRLPRLLRFVGTAWSFVAATCAAADLRGKSNVERMWLAPASPPGRVIVAWESAEEEASIIEVAADPLDEAGARRIVDPRKVRRHEIEVAAPRKYGPWFYRIGGEAGRTPWQFVQGLEADELRVVVVGDIGFAKRPWAAAVLEERPHLLLTAGDNVPQLHADGKPARLDDVSAFRRLIDSAPELFASTPLLPVLGNHDREIRPRGPKPPAEPVYDATATAYRRFFALPGREWLWHYDVPEFGVRLLALDLNHVQDFGTTWQTCHAFDADSEQLAWYRKTLDESSAFPHVVTIYNEKHSVVRGLAAGAWRPPLLRNSALVTGFGYFAERSTFEGVPCFNTSLSGTGDKYPDPNSAVLKSEDGYLLLRFRGGSPPHAELKSLNGDVLDAVDLGPRPTSGAKPPSR